ncbi:MAG: outer membrane beta-barrel protein [Prevotellaceae bacterium]|nr:outer membrane beta-barrel protein [Prevotellaceae bacterium]
MKKTLTMLAFVLSLSAQAQEADSVAVKNDSAAWDMNLKEVNVTASAERTEGNKTVVTFTKEMRRGMRNTAQLLGNLRNFNYDAMSNSIEYNNKKNIIVLVDSLEKGNDYVYNLHHHRFAKVEIIDQPTGKYQGYDVLVNLVTVKNYKGYEGLLLANQRMMPAGVNSGKFIFLQQQGGFTYTRDKWNFLVHADNWMSNKAHYQKWYEKTYPMHGLTERVLHDRDTYEALEDNSYTNLNASVDYQLSKNHSFSWTYTYNYNHNQDQMNYLLEQTRTQVGTVDTIAVSDVNNTYGRNHSTALFYRGKTGAWSYDADFNYVYNRTTPDNALQKGADFYLHNHYNDHMNYTRFRSSAWRPFFDNNMTLSFGYQNTWKDYKREDFASHKQLNTNGFLRNQVWFSLWSKFSASGENNASLSGSAEQIHIRSNGKSEDQMAWSASAMYWRKLTEKNWIRFNYDCSVYYPNQEQTSSYGFFTDSLTWSGGNPFLRSNMTHQLRMWFDAWWCFNCQAGVIYSPNIISDIAELRHGMLPSGVEGDYIANTYVNSSYYAPWVSVSFTKHFLKNFVYKADAKYTWQKAEYEEYKQHGHIFNFTTSLQYYSPKYKFGGTVYYAYQHAKGVSPQSQTLDLNGDICYIVLYKSLFNDKLDIQFIGGLPFKSNDGLFTTKTFSPALLSASHTNTWRSTNRGALQLTLTYRFMGGKSVRQYNREMSNEK